MRGFEIQIDIWKSVVYFAILAFFASVPTPGMAGTLDAGSKLALEKLTASSSEQAVAFTITVHFLILLFTMVAGFFSLSRMGLTLKIIKKARSKENEVS